MKLEKTPFYTGETKESWKCVKQWNLERFLPDSLLKEENLLGLSLKGSNIALFFISKVKIQGHTKLWGKGIELVTYNHKFENPMIW